jgi:hypothetical protein
MTIYSSIQSVVGFVNQKIFVAGEWAKPPGAIGPSKVKLADRGNPIRPARIGLGGPRPDRTASLPAREMRTPRD